MTIVMVMRWPGVTIEQYDAVRDVVKFETNLPEGGMFHVAAYDGNALRVTDVWESAESFQRFVDERLMPGVTAVGITAQPEIEIYPTHNIFTPGYTRKS